MRHPLSIAAALSFALTAPANGEALLPADLDYLGAFLLPVNSTWETWGDFQSSYRGSQMSYRAAGDGGAGSLLLSYGTSVQEIRLSNITPRMSALQTATVISGTTIITSGSLSGLLQNDSTGGVKLVTNRGSQGEDLLYWGSYEYYNTDGTDYNALGVSRMDLGTPAAKGVWHVGPSGAGYGDWNFAAKHGEYVFSVPQAWADANLGGRSILTGRTRESAGAGGAAGPVLTAIAPINYSAAPAGGTALSATPLVSFDTGVAVYQSGTGWQKWRMGGDPSWDYYSVMDRVKDGEWVETGSKRAIVLVMRHGTFENDPTPCTNAAGGSGYNGGFCVDPLGRTPPWCYGEAYTVCPLASPASSSSGFHAGPYRARLVFIDPDDLASVYAGTLAYDAVDGYTVYDLHTDWGTPSGTVLDRNGGNEPCGIAYDATTRRLYVCQSNGNDPAGHPNPAYPVVHVYEVAASAGDTTPPTVTSSTIPSAGTAIAFGFDESVTYAGAAPTISSTGGPVTLSGCGAVSSTITCNTSRQVLGAETVQASYTQPGDGIEDLAGNDLASFSGQSVTNQSAQQIVVLSALLPTTGTRYPKEVAQTTIGVTTSKAATCRHGRVPGLSWAGLTPYSTTGGTVHSATIGLVPGEGRQTCSRCLDTLAQQYSGDACTRYSVRPERKQPRW